MNAAQQMKRRAVRAVADDELLAVGNRRAFAVEQAAVEGEDAVCLDAVGCDCAAVEAQNTILSCEHAVSGVGHVKSSVRNGDPSITPTIEASAGGTHATSIADHEGASYAIHTERVIVPPDGAAARHKDAVAACG